MRLVIAGSRDLRVTNEVLTSHVRAFLYPNADVTRRIGRDEPGPLTEIVSGCAKGVDECAIVFALRHGIDLRKFPADWDAHGKGAGPIRNEQMARYADAALIICKGTPTPGSSNMATWMLAFGKPVKVVLV